MKSFLKFTIILLILVVSNLSFAQKVYLNGVEITGIKNQTFQNATVNINSSGDVLIQAEGYKVERVELVDRGTAGQETTKMTGNSSNQTTKTTNTTTMQNNSNTGSKTPPVDPGSSSLTKRYWLVTQSNAPQMVHWSIEIYVNGVFYKSLNTSEQFAPQEVTKFLHPGRNSIVINATKNTASGEQTSNSSQHWYQIVVGEGHAEGATVIIDNPNVTMSVSNSQSPPLRRELILTAQ